MPRYICLLIFNLFVNSFHWYYIIDQLPILFDQLIKIVGVPNTWNLKLATDNQLDYRQNKNNKTHTCTLQVFYVKNTNLVREIVLHEIFYSNLCYYSYTKNKSELRTNGLNFAFDSLQTSFITGSFFNLRILISFFF